MKTPFSRRSFLLGLGGGIAATSLVWGFSGLDFWSEAPRVPAAASTTSYVDHEGWWLTPADKKGLLSSVPVKRLEDTNLPGSDIASRVVSDVDACALWCTTDPRCRSFAFTARGGRANTCWIKDSVPKAVVEEGFTSGILE